MQLILILKLLMFFAPSLGLAKDLTAGEPIDCGQYLSKDDLANFSGLPQYHSSRLIWVQYGTSQLTIKPSVHGESQVILNIDGQYEFVTDPAKKHLLRKFFYQQTAPKEMELVENSYPKIGKGFAYRILKSAVIYTRYLPVVNGAVRIPGLPPMYVRKISSEVYIDVPHPETFNAYIGYDLFYPMTIIEKHRFNGEIPPLTYLRIIILNRFPITLVDRSLFLHDILGHGTVMASVIRAPLWQKTVDISRRVFLIIDKLPHNLNFQKREEFSDRAMAILSSVAAWESWANGSSLNSSTNKNAFHKALKELRAEIGPTLDEAQSQLDRLEQEIAQLKMARL